MTEYYYKKISGSEKRENEIKTMVDDFVELITVDDSKILKIILEREGVKTSIINVNTINSYTEKICEAYYSYLSFFKRKLLTQSLDAEQYVNISKIISGLELAIIYTKPISIEGDIEATAVVNAHLAFFCALTFLIGWHGNNYPSKIEWQSNQADELSEFVDEHLKWLIMLNPQAQYPYMSNAQTWRLLYMLIQERTKNGKNI